MDINKFVEIYTNKNDTLSFDFGMIIEENKEGIVILSFSNDGSYDSTQYIEKAGIYLREYGDEYCKEMIEKIEEEDISENYIELTKDDDLKSQILKYCIRNNLLTSVELYNSNCVDVYGIICDVANGTVNVAKLDENDMPDGCASIVTSAITRIGFDNRRTKG